jgi:PAS domain S-box-containing protein
MEEVPSSIAGQIEQAVRDNPGAVVALIDSDGIFRFMSPSVTSIHGYLSSDCVGRSYTDFFESEDATHVGLGIQDALLTGNSVELTRNVRSKTGSFHRMRGTAHEVVDEDTGDAYVLSISLPCQ